MSQAAILYGCRGGSHTHGWTQGVGLPSPCGFPRLNIYKLSLTPSQIEERSPFIMRPQDPRIYPQRVPKLNTDLEADYSTPPSPSHSAI